MFVYYVFCGYYVVDGGDFICWDYWLLCFVCFGVVGSGLFDYLGGYVLFRCEFGCYDFCCYCVV